MPELPQAELDVAIFIPPDAYADMSDATAEQVASDIGWKNAISFHEKLKRTSDPLLKERVKRSAVLAILGRSRGALGSISRPYKLQSESWERFPDHELDLDASLDDDPLLENLLVETKTDKRAEVIICLDTSLSMTGRKLAMLGVTVGTLALQLPAEDLAVINFESDARLVKGLGTDLNPFQTVARFLEAPAKGLTNMEAALKLAIREQAKGNLSRRHVILMSDGRFTAGARPDYLVPQLERLHVVQAGNPWSHNRFFRRLAKLGQGRFLQVKHFDDLPRALYSLVYEILR